MVGVMAVADATTMGIDPDPNCTVDSNSNRAAHGLRIETSVWWVIETKALFACQGYRAFAATSLAIPGRPVMKTPLGAGRDIRVGCTTRHVSDAL